MGEKRELTRSEIKRGFWTFHRADKEEAFALAETYKDIGMHTKVARTPNGKGYTIVVTDFPIPTLPI